MIDFQTLIGFSAAVSLLAISPGPDNIFVGLQSVRYGFKSALMVILGLMFGCLFHTTLLATGFSVLLKQHPSLIVGIQIAGAAYLFYLAFGLFRAGSPKDFSSKHVANKTNSALFSQGLIMNVLNPKVSLFFISLFPGFVFLPEHNPYIQFFSLGIVFIFVSTLVFVGIALLASRFIDLEKQQSSFLKRLHWAQIILFIGIGIFLLLP